MKKFMGKNFLLTNDTAKVLYHNYAKELPIIDYHCHVSPKEIAENKPGFIRAMWCGDRECEDKLKEVAGVTSRCIPFEQETISETCVCCGKKAKDMLYWGKAY